MNKSNELLDLYNFIRATPVLTLSTYGIFVRNCPGWLIDKLQLWPTSYLTSKLKCLYYQLQEFFTNSACIDIEDHYLSIGAPNADLTYIVDNKYVLVDVTTSSNEELKQSKLDRLLDKAANIHNHEVSACKVITINAPIEFKANTEVIHLNDDLDELANLYLSSSTHDQLDFNYAIEENLYPLLTDACLLHLAEVARPQKEMPKLMFDLSKHVEEWGLLSGIEQDHMKELLSRAKCLNLESPIKFRLAESSYKVKTFEEIWAIHEPITMISLLCAQKWPSECDVLIRIPFRSSPEYWTIVEENHRLAMSMIEYKTSSKSKAQLLADADEDPHVIYAVVSSKMNTHPNGFQYNSEFSLAVGKAWAGYGSKLLRRETQVKTEYVDKDLKPITLAVVQRAQAAHKALLDWAQAPSEYNKTTMANKIMYTFKSTGNSDVANILLNATKSELLGNLFGNNLWSLLTHQHDIARTISLMLSLKMTRHRFRVAFAGGMNYILAVGTGNTLVRMKNVPVSIYSDSSMSERLTLSLSSRLLTWWTKLPYVYVLRCAMAAQHNIQLKADSIYRDNLSSCVEHIVMHLGTRQQESLMQDQTRYVLVGLTSHDGDPIGPLGKIKDVYLKTPSSIVYLARLCYLQMASYFIKNGSHYDFQMSHDNPPLVVPPQHSTILTSYGQYVDAIFDSKIFNKDKDNKVDAQSMDWLGLLENELRYREQLVSKPSFLAGYSLELSAVILQALRTKDLRILINDMADPNGASAKSMIQWWTQTLSDKMSQDFTWNFMACLTIFHVQSRGKKLHKFCGDYTGIFADIGSQSLSGFLSSAGSTADGEPTLERQSVRKSTAMLSFFCKNDRQKQVPTDRVGQEAADISRYRPNRYQSLLSESIDIVTSNNSMYVVSRTETKEQSGSNREFSAMNAVGVLCSRATERVFANYLAYVPTDRMTDPHTDKTLYNMVTSQDEDRETFLSADNSRFGPNQIMAKSRVLIWALLMYDPNDPYDKVAAQVLYHYISTSTRKMESKYTKMPFELQQTISEHGGFHGSYNVKPGSTIGKICGLSLKLFPMKTLEPGFQQRWGMYQGSLGMLSSCASSFLHDFYVAIITKSGLAKTVQALVTNDDSGILFSGVTQDIPMSVSSFKFKELLAYILKFGGQILNKFKSVSASVLKEFHSTFATRRGLVVPELKLTFSSLQGGRGESITADAKQVLTDAVGVMRHGCSVFTSTTLACLLTVFFCDQYNRWESFKAHGCRPAELGGPVHIDLIKEFVLPGYGSFKWYHDNVPEHLLLTMAKALVVDRYNVAGDIVQSNEFAGVRMTTRRIYRESRGQREITWTHPIHSLPLTGLCDTAPMITSLTCGLLKGSTEAGAEPLLVRFCRNQVKADWVNIKCSPQSVIGLVLGKEELSYKELDSITVSNIVDVLSRITFGEFNASLKEFANLIHHSITVVSKGNNSPTLGALVRVAQTRGFPSCGKPVFVKPSPFTSSQFTLDSAIRLWGSAQVTQALSRQYHGFYDVDSAVKIHEEVRQLMTTQLMFNEMSVGRTGPVVIFSEIEPPSSISTVEYANLTTQSTIRGLTTFSKSTSVFAQSVITTVTPVTPDVTDTVITFKEQLAAVRARRPIVGALFPLADGNIVDLLNASMYGWMYASGLRYKIKTLTKKYKHSGRKLTSKLKLVTVTDIKRTFYHHYLVGVEAPVKLSDFGNSPDYIKENFDGWLSPGDTKEHSRVEKLYVTTRADFAMIQLVKVNRFIMLKSRLGTWPLTWVEPDVIGTIESNNEQGASDADVIIAYSLGGWLSRDSRVRDSELINPTIQTANVTASQYSTEWLSDYFTMGLVPSFLPDEVPQEWYLSALRLAAIKFSHVLTSVEIDEIDFNDEYEPPDDDNPNHAEYDEEAFDDEEGETDSIQEYLDNQMEIIDRRGVLAADIAAAQESGQMIDLLSDTLLNEFLDPS